MKLQNARNVLQSFLANESDDDLRFTCQAFEVLGLLIEGHEAGNKWIMLMHNAPRRFVSSWCYAVEEKRRNREVVAIGSFWVAGC